MDHKPHARTNQAQPAAIAATPRPFYSIEGALGDLVMAKCTPLANACGYDQGLLFASMSGVLMGYLERAENLYVAERMTPEMRARSVAGSELLAEFEAAHREEFRRRMGLTKPEGGETTQRD